MSDFLSYATAMLHAISVWLMAEPMIWIFSLIIIAWLIKIFINFRPRI